MILFIEDWEKYPNSIVDNSTSNTSFIEMAGVYKQMGIKNYAMILALHNPSLVGVDPHSDNLTTLQQRSIMVECNENPWYYFREVSRAPSHAGDGSSPFKANRGNIATIWCFFNHITSLLIQPRQTGKSFTCESIDAGMLNVWGINMSMNLLTKDEKLRAESISRVKGIIDALPKFMVLRTKKDNNNSESIEISLLGNVLKSHVAQAAKKNAFNAGRGLTSPYVRVDEFAYYKNIAITLPAALPSMGAAMEDAKANNMPYGVILTTTAGWLNSEDGAYAYSFYESATVWTEKFFDLKDLKTLRAVLRKSNGQDKETIVIDMNHRQLGKTDAWLKKRILDAESTGNEAETDFLNIWADGDSASPFDKQLLKKIKDGIREDSIVKIYESGYMLRWYYDPKSLDNIPLICGSDTSDAVGNDDITLVIIRGDTGETVAVGEYNETNTISFANWVLELLLTHKNMTLIMERRSSGTSILDFVFRGLSRSGINPYSRCFNWIVQEKNSNNIRFNSMLDYGIDEEFQDKHRKEIGYPTSASGRASRDKLYGQALTDAMSNVASNTYDKKLVMQILGLKTRNNRIDHKTTGKDDLVIAWLLAYWFAMSAKNTEVYNIGSTVLLSRVLYSSGISESDRKEMEHNMEVVDNIKVLINKMKTEDDFTIQQALKHQINKYKTMIPKEYDKDLNVEVALNKIETVDNSFDEYEFNII